MGAPRHPERADPPTPARLAPQRPGCGKKGTSQFAGKAHFSFHGAVPLVVSTPTHRKS